MRVLLKWDNKLIAAEIIEASVCDKDDYCIELPDNVIVLHLLCAQRYEDCGEGHWNFQIFCKSKEQAENFVKTLYSDGFLDLTEYEKYTYANIDEDFDENDFEKIENIAKNKNISQQLDTEKPDWERENREKYAWEE